jgi:capsular polysaccharide biosynthesis protein
MEFLQTIKDKWQTVLVITVLVSAVVFSISAFLKPQYGSEVSILVIQRQPNDKVDAFSAAKSAEYLSDILAKVAYSESFIQNVLDSPYNAEIDFPLGDENKKEYWKKMVDIDQVNNTGIIKVTVYDQDRVNAEKIAEAISWAYIIRGHQYHGGGERVEIEKIDGPITPMNPSKPNLLANTLLGVILGLIGSVMVIYFFDDFELKLFNKKKRFDEFETIVDIQIKEPDAFDAEISFEKALVGGGKKKESVNSISQSKGVPGNLPTFEGDVNSLVRGGDAEEADEESEVIDSLDKDAETIENKESTEAEVREKLNKLLRGEM